jgi:Zn-dependent protease
MNFFDLSLPMGRIAGINIRIHITFLLVIYQYMGKGSVLSAALFIFALYLSILLHELGHSFAARFCDGESDEIILWPLGGLALCKTPFHPTAHLITTVAGPLVSLALWLIFSLLRPLSLSIFPESLWLYRFTDSMVWINGSLFLFNLIPAFPMDGGRMFLEVLWYRIGFERAASASLKLSRFLAVIGLIMGFGGNFIAPQMDIPFLNIFWGNSMIGIISLFILFSAESQIEAVGAYSAGYNFSIKERLTRWKRQKKFFGTVNESNGADVESSFHRCAVCGVTERSGKMIGFRVASDGQEYCIEHLPSRASHSVDKAKTP